MSLPAFERQIAPTSGPLREAPPGSARAAVSARLDLRRTAAKTVRPAPTVRPVAGTGARASRWTRSSIPDPSEAAAPTGRPALMLRLVRQHQAQASGWLAGHYPTRAEPAAKTVRPAPTVRPVAGTGPQASGWARWSLPGPSRTGRQSRSPCTKCGRFASTGPRPQGGLARQYPTRAEPAAEAGRPALMLRPVRRIQAPSRQDRTFRPPPAEPNQPPNRSFCTDGAAGSLERRPKGRPGWPVPLSLEGGQIHSVARRRAELRCRSKAGRRTHPGRSGRAPSRQRATKYLAWGWWQMSAEVVCSGWYWKPVSSDTSTPMRSASSSSATFSLSSRSGQAG
jgi:hypothetical protein